MNYLSKLILNGLEMLIKDREARDDITNINSSVTNIEADLSNIWNGQSTTNYYVSPTGDDTNDGSSAHPFKTIEHAVSKGFSYAAMTHDAFNVHLLEGDYYGRFEIGNLNENRRVNLFIHGIVNIHGQLIVATDTIVRALEETDRLHFYSDSQYTQTQYTEKPTLFIYNNIRFYSFVPLTFHIYGNEYTGIGGGGASEIVLPYPAVFEGNAKHGIVTQRSIVNFAVDATNFVCEQSFYGVSDTLIFSAGTAVTYDANRNNIVQGSNLTPYS